MFRRACLAVVAVTCSLHAQAGDEPTCADYNALGVPVQVESDLGATRITSAQIDMVRRAVATEAAQIAAIGVTPLAIKFSRIRSDSAWREEFAGGSSTLIRYACFKTPATPFATVVEEQVERVINYMDSKASR